MAVTNVNYPHRDDSLYPESAELERGVTETVLAILGDDSYATDADRAVAIAAAMRTTWQATSDAIDGQPIKVHFSPTGDALPGENGLTISGAVRVAGFDTETGKLTGMTISSARVLDADGRPVQISATS